MVSGEDSPSSSLAPASRSRAGVLMAQSHRTTPQEACRPVLARFCSLRPEREGDPLQNIRLARLALAPRGRPLAEEAAERPTLGCCRASANSAQRMRWRAPTTRPSIASLLAAALRAVSTTCRSQQRHAGTREHASIGWLTCRPPAVGDPMRVSEAMHFRVCEARPWGQPPLAQGGGAYR
eukprot:scaffold4958_cov406-Prasinococcus_capsulatus_cf.AAC.1